jgi:hypothetical protein
MNRLRLICLFTASMFLFTTFFIHAISDPWHVTYSTPNFMTALCLPVKRKSKLFGSFDNYSICHSRELFTHTLTGTNNSTLNVSYAVRRRIAFLYLCTKYYLLVVRVEFWRCVAFDAVKFVPYMSFNKNSSLLTGRGFTEDLFDNV